MAREEAAWEDRQRRGAMLAPGRWVTPWSLSVALTLAFVLAAFAAYYYFLLGDISEPLSPRPAAFNVPVRLADAFLHGRLDIANAPDLVHLEFAPYEGKFYATDPPMPAIVLLPGVLLFGQSLNQALVSVVIAGLTAGVVYRLMRGLTDKLSIQVWMTLLFSFGTTYWWVSASGASWHLAHTVALLFLFLAIYETLVTKRPFLAGLFVGAAYWSRLSIGLAFPFFLIMFSDQWLPQSGEQSLLRRIKFKPLLQLAAGGSVFLILSFIYNYLSFETPLPAAYHHYNSQFDPPPVMFDISYISLQIGPPLKAMPIFQSGAPYVLPSWGGLAIWATTPAFLLALFAGIKDRRVIAGGAALLAVSIITIVWSARGFPLDFLPTDFPLGLQYYPFLGLMGYALFVSIRNGNKLVVACWSAIIPMALLYFTLFARPPQFGYQYGIDYYPFLLLLTLSAIGDKIRWYHVALIILAIIVNLWGVLWIHDFASTNYLGLTWVTW
ncbi:MAG TPA: hypothetical protein VI729_01285 [Anaerolineales bacterium]|nr:hypothetical protein [Anaerolineales bacterium]